MYPKLLRSRRTTFFCAPVLFFLVSPAVVHAGGQRPQDPNSSLTSAQPFMEQLKERGDKRISIDWKWDRDDRHPNFWTVTILGPKGWDKAALLVDDVLVAAGAAPHDALTYNFGKHPPGVHRVTLAVTRGRDYGYNRREIRVVEPEGSPSPRRTTQPLSQQQGN